MISIVSYGAGTNSTAMLIGMVNRGYKPPELILFADTGGERPETYAYLGIMSDWLADHGYPRIEVVFKVDKKGDRLTLEQDCLNKKMLPSIAYGYKTCSQKYKIQPQDKFCNNHPRLKEEWKHGRKVTKLIGFHAGEAHRASDRIHDKYDYKYPLIDWDWGHYECIAAIDSAGLSRPGKSACFFCPNAGFWEVHAMNRTHPELVNRAIAMEDNANLTSIKGLGRGSFSWGDIIRQGDMFDMSSCKLSDREMCNECYDGES